MRPRRVLRARRFCGSLRFPKVHRETRLLGSGCQLQRAKTRLDGRHWRVPKRRRHLHRLHHAGLPGQIHAVHGRAAGSEGLLRHDQHLRQDDPNSARIYQRNGEQGTEVAASSRGTNHPLQARGVIRDKRAKIMATITSVAKGTPTGSKKLVEMNWDPITQIARSLGIFTKIDFDNLQVAECHSTSSIFRGYSIFMKGKDPRDAHFITSRICGICGDNHATCATYAQNMAFGVKPPPIAEWIGNLGEAAEYMFDQSMFQAV